MALREISIGLGILAGGAGVTNSGYALYQNFVVKPAQNAEYNMSLMTETPLVVESVEIQPVSDIAMKVEVTVKIFRTGDILVESGNRRQYIPFRLTGTEVAQNLLDALIPSANAAETQLIDGVEYEVQVLHYQETVKPLPDNRMQRVRSYADGNVETSTIDMRSNKVLESSTTHKSLDEAERKAIESSPYKKKIFVPVKK